MKTFFKYFVFLVLSCSCFTAISKDTSFLVGNNAGVGDGNFNGPSTAAQVTFRYASTTNNLVFYKPTQLGPTGVKLRWEQLDTASGGGFLGNDSNLLIVFYVQIMPDDFVMQLHRF